MPCFGPAPPGAGIYAGIITNWLVPSYLGPRASRQLLTLLTHGVHLEAALVKYQLLATDESVIEFAARLPQPELLGRFGRLGCDLSQFYKGLRLFQRYCGRLPGALGHGPLLDFLEGMIECLCHDKPSNYKGLIAAAGYAGAPRPSSGAIDPTPAQLLPLPQPVLPTKVPPLETVPVIGLIRPLAASAASAAITLSTTVASSTGPAQAEAPMPVAPTPTVAPVGTPAPAPLMSLPTVRPPGLLDPGTRIYQTPPDREGFPYLERVTLAGILVYNLQDQPLRRVELHQDKYNLTFRGVSDQDVYPPRTPDYGAVPTSGCLMRLTIDYGDQYPVVRISRLNSTETDSLHACLYAHCRSARPEMRWTVQGLTLHIMKEHLGPTGVQCSFCARCFPGAPEGKQVYADHLRLQHSKKMSQELAWLSKNAWPIRSGTPRSHREKRPFPANLTKWVALAVACRIIDCNFAVTTAIQCGRLPPRVIRQALHPQWSVQKCVVEWGRFLAKFGRLGAGLYGAVTWAQVDAFQASYAAGVLKQKPVAWSGDHRPIVAANVGRPFAAVHPQDIPAPAPLTPVTSTTNLSTSTVSVYASPLATPAASVAPQPMFRAPSPPPVPDVLDEEGMALVLARDLLSWPELTPAAHVTAVQLFELLVRTPELADRSTLVGMIRHCQLATSDDDLEQHLRDILDIALTL